jgi:hypothetical protein
VKRSSQVGGVTQLFHQPRCPPAQDRLDGYGGVVEFAHRSQQRQRGASRQLDLHPVLVAAELGEAGPGLVADHEGAE